MKLPANSLSLNDLLTSCSSLPRLKCIHALTLGLSHHLALTTKLISLATALTPSMSYVHQLFDAMPLKDSFTWNTLIRGYADKGPCLQVPILYSHMNGSGLSPDHFTFPFIVRSCTVLSAIREGKQTHCNIIKTGFDSNVFVQSALVALYSQSNNRPHPFLILRRIENSDAINANIMRSSINRPPTPNADDKAEQEPTLQELINIKLIVSGEKEKLVELLRERLVESGWRDEMRALCRKSKSNSEVTRDLCLLARMMAANLYYSQIEDLMFELSMWRCTDELRDRANELHQSSRKDAKHYIEKRKEEAARIRVKYPERIPIIIEKADRSDIPAVDKKNEGVIASGAADDAICIFVENEEDKMRIKDVPCW